MPEPTPSSKPIAGPAPTPRLPPSRELRRWLFPVFAVVLLILGAGVGLLLWPWISAGLSDSKELATARLSLATLVLTVVGGGVGLFAVYLAARRQRTAEQDLQLRDRIQAHTEAAEARRAVTDQFGRAIDHLRADNTVARMSGAYALVRLAQDAPEMRQTVINVICGYLRQPFTPPSHKTSPRRGGLPRTVTHPAPAHRRPLRIAPTPADADGEKKSKAMLELEVRLTIQRLVRDHLQPGSDSGTEVPTNLRYWGPLEVDLTGATLVDFDFTYTRPGQVRFANATFAGLASFEGTTFASPASFEGATFTCRSCFDYVTFDGMIQFTSAIFGGHAAFDNSTFAGLAVFDGAAFASGAWYRHATFNGPALFAGTTFGAAAEFRDAAFGATALFENATFAKDADFNGAAFSGSAQFEGAVFSGPTVFEAASFAKPPDFTHVRVGTAAGWRPHVWPQGWRAQPTAGRPESGTLAGQWGLLTRVAPDEGDVQEQGTLRSESPINDSGDTLSG